MHARGLGRSCERARVTLIKRATRWYFAERATRVANPGALRMNRRARAWYGAGKNSGALGNSSLHMIDKGLSLQRPINKREELLSNS